MCFPACACPIAALTCASVSSEHASTAFALPTAAHINTNAKPIHLTGTPALSPGQAPTAYSFVAPPSWHRHAASGEGGQSILQLTLYVPILVGTLYPRRRK